jgi:pyrimidine-nucleoside phosphorylase
MRVADLIRKKRDGGPLGRDEIAALIGGVSDGSVPDYQTSALLMAIVLRGMTADETAWLTEAMIASGTRLDLSDLSQPAADKHSTGGVGDKTSLVLAPLVAACGVLVPMMSGRGLGHTGGTLDKLDAIPGFRTDLTIPELRSALARVGCAIVSQSDELVPADRRLYALRDVTATVESVPLIAASIMSKKIAEGVGALVLDVKCGAGAFMKTTAEARMLAATLVAIGERHGVRTEAVITAMDAPLGRAIGNALEVAEAVDVLKGEGPADVEALTVALATRMLVLAGSATGEADASARVREALASGAGLERFQAMVETQGGDPRIVDEPGRLPSAPVREAVPAPRAGFVARLDAEGLGLAAMALGAGRDRVDGRVDPGVGLRVLAGVGSRVEAGTPVVEIHGRDSRQIDTVRPLVERAIDVRAVPPDPQPLILDRVTVPAVFQP